MISLINLQNVLAETQFIEFNRFDMEDDYIYQDDRIAKIKALNSCLRKSLASVGHQKYSIARDFFDEAAISALEAVKDNNQFYTKEIFNTFLKFFAAFKKIKYDDGARWCLLETVTFIRKLKMPKERKIQLIGDIIKKYEASGGDRNDVKERFVTAGQE